MGIMYVNPTGYTVSAFGRSDPTPPAPFEEGDHDDPESAGVILDLINAEALKYMLDKIAACPVEPPPPPPVERVTVDFDDETDLDMALALIEQSPEPEPEPEPTIKVVEGPAYMRAGEMFYVPADYFMVMKPNGIVRVTTSE